MYIVQLLLSFQPCVAHKNFIFNKVMNVKIFKIVYLNLIFELLNQSKVDQQYLNELNNDIIWHNIY